MRGQNQVLSVCNVEVGGDGAISRSLIREYVAMQGGNDGLGDAHLENLLVKKKECLNEQEENDRSNNWPPEKL
jgi:hypothetical protein